MIYNFHLAMDYRSPSVAEEHYNEQRKRLREEGERFFSMSSRDGDGVFLGGLICYPSSGMDLEYRRYERSAQEVVEYDFCPSISLPGMMLMSRIERRGWRFSESAMAARRLN